jgi:hypothetical protein
MIGRGLDVNKETSLNGMLLQSNTSFVLNFKAKAHKIKK